MSLPFILVLFIIWRFFDFLILFFAPKFIPYLGFFPYVQELKKFHLPQWVYSLANFDGVHYLKIASHGYEQYEQAFFPLYPLLIHSLKFLFFNNELIAGLVISNLAFLFGLWIFTKYLGIRNWKLKIWPLILLMAFPTSFFFGAFYTEGLFFFLVITSLYFLEKKHYLIAGIFGFFASLTRFMGVFLIIPFIIHLFKKQVKSSRPINLNNVTGYFACLFPLLGLLTYGFYLWKTTGDPFFFLNSQPIFGANRSTSIVLLPQVYFRYIKIFFTAQVDFRYFVSLFEFSIFTFVFIVLIIDLFRNMRFIGNWFTPKNSEGIYLGKLVIGNFNRFAFDMFSLANLLIPTLTGTFSSIPRYALLSLSLFITLGTIQNKIIKIFLAIIFLVLHIIMLGYFGQGYFIS